MASKLHIPLLGSKGSQAKATKNETKKIPTEEELKDRAATYAAWAPHGRH